MLPAAKRPGRGPAKAKVTVADLLRKYGPAYLARCGDEVDEYGRQVLQRLMDCRTAAMGGHLWRCEACGYQHFGFGSCNNRHCTTCCRGPQLKWMEKLRGWQLPVRYYHVVFTLPHELCELILANRGPLFSLLLRCAGHALLSLGRQQLGADVGVVATLHPWGQLMLAHPHAHCLVSPGGLSSDGRRWVTAPDGLLAREDLAERFRELYLHGIERLFRRGELTLPTSMRGVTDVAALWEWLAPVTRKRWIVDCQGPPVACKDEEAVLKYLARYVAGSVIHDWRIVSDEDGWVTIRYKNYRTGQRELTRMRGEEFVRRFCLHLLPKGFHRWRCYGLFSGRRRNEALPHCRKLLAQAAAQQDASAGTDGSDEQEFPAEAEPEKTHKRCPRCLLRAMIWVARLTAEQMQFWQWREQQEIAQQSEQQRLERQRREQQRREQQRRERQRNVQCNVEPPSEQDAWRIRRMEIRMSWQRGADERGESPFPETLPPPDS